jgi:hypothetical protein
MKRLFKTSLFAAALFAAAQGKAQTHDDHETVGHKIGHTAKTVGHATAHAAVAVGHKTSELAAKGAAAVTNKRYDGHWGPHGENVYIDHQSRYYYVNKSGHRIYTNKSALRDKPLR